jgi:serine protease Do
MLDRDWVKALLLMVSVGFSAHGQAASSLGLPDFTVLVEQNSAAVVNISSRQSQENYKHPKIEKRHGLPELPEGIPFEDLLRRFFDKDQGNGKDKPGREYAKSLGSGFILDADGYILTNNHVVDDADEIIVRLSDRRELEAELVGADERSDLALLKVDAEDLPIVKLGRSNALKVGEWVMAIGSPFGFDHSVSVGVVSALGRSLPSENYVPFIQTDVAINPGNSGGPLFNLDGEVVGINSQIYSRTGGFMGLSFAIPMDIALSVVKQLKDSGHVDRGWLGIMIQDVTRGLAESFGMDRPYGALVSQILEGSPAEDSKLQVGDIIISYDGKEVASSSELPHMVGQAKVGAEKSLMVVRDGKEIELDITIGKLPDQGARVERKKKTIKGQIKRLGMNITELTKEQLQQLDIDEGGVQITHLEGGEAAQSSGLRLGDVITKLDNVEVTGIDKFKELVAQIPDGRSVPVLVIRKQGPLFLALKIPE